MNEDNTKCFYITSIVYGKKLIVEKLLAFSFGLYCTSIKSIKSYVVVNQKFNNSKNFILWYDRLAHLRSSMMQRVTDHSHRYLLKNQKIILPNGYLCNVCS